MEHARECQKECEKKDVENKILCQKLDAAERAREAKSFEAPEHSFSAPKHHPSVCAPGQSLGFCLFGDNQDSDSLLNASDLSNSLLDDSAMTESSCGKIHRLMNQTLIHNMIPTRFANAAGIAQPQCRNHCVQFQHAVSEEILNTFSPDLPLSSRSDISSRRRARHLTPGPRIRPRFLISSSQSTPQNDPELTDGLIQDTVSQFLFTSRD